MAQGMTAGSPFPVFFGYVLAMNAFSVVVIYISGFAMPW